MNWDNVKAFLAVERAGSVAAAGVALAVDESTVARRLRSLENDLGARLFYTSGGRKILSAFGSQILPGARDMEVARCNIEAASKSAGKKPSGTVRISASSMVARHVLMPRIGDFRRAHPGLVLELSASNDVVDLARLEADIAVRMARPQSGDYTVRKICTIEYRFYEHRDHVGCDHWIGFAGALAQLPDVRAFGERIGTSPCITTDEPSLMLEAVLSGEVAALLPGFVGQNRPELIAVADIPATRHDVWLVFRSDMKTAPNIRAATEWIDGCFAQVQGAV
jgi:DNA-binding transcriptional LysR family regulator